MALDLEISFRLLLHKKKKIKPQRKLVHSCGEFTVYSVFLLCSWLQFERARMRDTDLFLWPKNVFPVILKTCFSYQKGTVIDRFLRKIFCPLPESEACWWADDFDQLFYRTKDFSVTVSALSGAVGLNLRTRVRVSSPLSAVFSSKPHLTHLIPLIKLFWRH